MLRRPQGSERFCGWPGHLIPGQIPQFLWPFLESDCRPMSSSAQPGLAVGRPGLLGPGGLTADEDFGEGGGLAIGILHHHPVGGCILNGASEKERARSAPPRLRDSMGSPPIGGKGGG